MLHRWMSADDRRWLLERFPELEATLAHLDRVDNHIALLTVGTGTEDRELGSSDERIARTDASSGRTRTGNLCA